MPESAMPRSFQARRKAVGGLAEGKKKNTAWGLRSRARCGSAEKSSVAQRHAQAGRDLPAAGREGAE